MNIWTQLLSLNGHPLDGESVRPAIQPSGASPTQSAAQSDIDQETQAARQAIALWRPAPGIAIR